MVPVTELWAAHERARRGDRDAAIAVMRKAVDELHQAGRLGYGVWGTGVLVEALLERGAEGDLAEAQEAIDRLANLPADEGSAMREITLLRLRALLARARGDDVAYRELVGRYRAMAESLGFEGHIALGRGNVEKPHQGTLATGPLVPCATMLPTITRSSGLFGFTFRHKRQPHSQVSGILVGTQFSFVGRGTRSFRYLRGGGRPAVKSARRTPGQRLRCRMIKDSSGRQLQTGRRFQPIQAAVGDRRRTRLRAQTRRCAVRHGSDHGRLVAGP